MKRAGLFIVMGCGDGDGKEGEGIAIMWNSTGWGVQTLPPYRRCGDFKHGQWYKGTWKKDEWRWVIRERGRSSGRC